MIKRSPPISGTSFAGVISARVIQEAIGFEFPMSSKTIAFALRPVFRTLPTMWMKRKNVDEAELMEEPVTHVCRSRLRCRSLGICYVTSVPMAWIHYVLQTAYTRRARKMRNPTRAFGPKIASQNRNDCMRRLSSLLTRPQGRFHIRFPLS